MAVDRVFNVVRPEAALRMNFRWMMRRLNRWGVSRRKLRGGFLHNKLGDRILERELWFPSRESLARAWLIGMPITMIPFLPLQSIIACGIGFLARANIPVCFAMQYLSNPATAIFHLSAGYFVGRLLLGESPNGVFQHVENMAKRLMDAPISQVFTVLSWKEAFALYAGSLVLGLAMGIAGYVGTHVLWKEKPRKTPVDRGPALS